jgi:hypothetical protein
MRHHAGREDRPCPGRAVGELPAKAPMAARFLAATSDRSGIWQARCQGTRRSAGLAQCHNQIG